jgi:hypothetical protein
LADDYKAENDVIRIKVKPKKTKKLTEALTNEVKGFDKNKGQISLSWEYINVNINFENLKK